MHEIGEIIDKYFEDKKYEYNYYRKFDYKDTYDICRIIIKYIPKKGRKKEYQERLYNLYKLFDKTIEAPVEIDSYENLYGYVNEGIIQYINEKINECSNIEEIKIYTDDIFNLINENPDILKPDKYKIIPNQKGELKKLYDLKKDNNIFEQLKNILPPQYDVKNKLMDIRIKSFKPNEIMNNEDLKLTINKLIENGKLDIKITLELIPEKDDENKKKQKEIKTIYETLCNNGEKMDDIEINLESSFWDTTNKYALKKIENSFKKIRNLKNISPNEETSLQILETLYKYIPPELKDNKKIEFIPNQYGDLLSYNDLSQEKDLNQNFKKMLKELFEYDIAKYLKHEKLKYNISKTLSIDDNIIQKINDGFKNYKGIKIKSKALIKFYPKIKENNYVYQFIDCYKALSKENFVEEEINTTNISIWEKAIKELLYELLKIINNDGNIQKTLIRIGLDEEKTFEKLNIFYSILFRFMSKDNINKFSFIPNENGIYKNLEQVYMNKDIDNEIKKVLKILNEKICFDHILIHHKIKLNNNHSEKTLEDIATVIDKEISKKYTQIDKMIQDANNKLESVKIDDNVKNSCELLIQKWFKQHKDKIFLFEFINSHLVDISVKILFDKESKNILEELLINNPESLIEMIKYKKPVPFFYGDSDDESIINENEEFSLSSSFDATLDDSINQGNYGNNFNFNLFNFGHNNNNRRRRRRRRNNHGGNRGNEGYIDNLGYLGGGFFNYGGNRNNGNNNQNIENSLMNAYNEGIKNYCKAQVYVYQELVNSHLFREIDWKNKVNENEEGELIILPNEQRYKVKKTYSNYDFVVKTNENKIYKISVKNGKNVEGSDLRFIIKYSQWNTLDNELNSMIFAFIYLKYGNEPEIHFSKNLKLNEL